MLSFNSSDFVIVLTYEFMIINEKFMQPQIPCFLMPYVTNHCISFLNRKFFGIIFNLISICFLKYVNKKNCILREDLYLRLKVIVCPWVSLKPRPIFFIDGWSIYILFLVLSIWDVEPYIGGRPLYNQTSFFLLIQWRN